MNIKRNVDGTFELFQSHLIDKIINNIGLTVSTSLKRKETPIGKPFINKDSSGIARKGIWNYRGAVGIISCLQG